MRPRRAGFSLAELLIVTAIAALLLGVAVPDLGALLRAQQIRTATNDLFGAIGLARAQAIARNRTVIVMPRDAAGVDWTQGWTVFADRDGDGVPGAADEILAVHGALPAGVTAAFAFTSPAAPYYIAYNGAGRSCGAGAGTARWGTLSLFHGGAVRRIKINMLGRARACDPERDDHCDGAAAPS
ncbi:GspH/FimT family pseudopilin [Massilia jejuensis]|uniref:Type II secretion system protein H n=1 Tax=Massilia jejuensis TaxID=648894 RepID=A0ABW0PDD9_9BURK